MDDALGWLRLSALIALFAGSCMGLGYLAGYLGRRRAWPTWTIGFASVLIGFLWPVILLVAAMYSARHYERRSASDPGDAPAMLLVSVITVGVPILFALGFPFALGGGLIARRRFRSLGATEQIVGRERRGRVS